MRRLITRRRLAELNAQDWADFRAHWPMRVCEVAKDFGIGVVLGVALSLAVLIYALHAVAG